MARAVAAAALVEEAVAAETQPAAAVAEAPRSVTHRGPALSQALPVSMLLTALFVAPVHPAMPI